MALKYKTQKLINKITFGLSTMGPGSLLGISFIILSNLSTLSEDFSGWSGILEALITNVRSIYCRYA